MSNKNRLSSYSEDQDGWEDWGDDSYKASKRRTRSARAVEFSADDDWDDEDDELPEELGRKSHSRRRDIEDRLERQRLRQDIFGDMDRQDRA
ncbi:hypothetical protein EH243_11815 [Amphritea opalescens]|uniref:Uncharacterized protein n=1 Tax=Amphritea opalescens TaxID=2490544 RepID=A0A430KQ75_9GAMM|nr:hypothetical protein [Amphritea opalescens]RTE65620.1 hypothetical protein EH243_11815 [Amphritea opalescens]